MEIHMTLGFIIYLFSGIVNIGMFTRNGYWFSLYFGAVCLTAASVCFLFIMLEIAKGGI